MIDWDDDPDEFENDDELLDGPDSFAPNLGRCCICEIEDPSVRNIVMLDWRAPAGMKGWGCLQCGLPMEGAVAVLCDDCTEAHRNGRKIEFACAGYPADNLRVPLATLTEPFAHDMNKHPEEA